MGPSYGRMPSRAKLRIRRQFEHLCESQGRDVYHERCRQSSIDLKGLQNHGNSCYQNVIIQSLMSCGPFMHLCQYLLLSSSRAEAGVAAEETDFPFWTAMARFVAQLNPPSLQCSSSSPSASLRLNFEHMFEGFYLHHPRGRQADAQEFLEYVLEILHEEFVQALGQHVSLEALGRMKQVLTDEHQVPPVGEITSSLDSDSQAWHEVGGKGRTNQISLNRVEEIESPITWLFKGKCRSIISNQQQRRVPASITIEPFHCLHLDVMDDQSDFQQSRMIQTLEQALMFSSRQERIDASQLSKRTILEELPVVLTLQLKRFTYSARTGPMKLHHFVSYPLDLEIPQSCVYQSVSSRATKYRLVSIVCHQGHHVETGHYTAFCCDVRNQWKHFNDEKVTSVTENQALDQLAFLLFYVKLPTST